MIANRIGSNRWILFVVILLLVMGAVVWLQPWKPIGSKVTENPRQRYATLYDAAWRQDDGRQPTLVTATLLVPEAIEALGKDTGRSSSEEQLWSNVNNLDRSSIAFVVTFDSVSGAIPDSTIEQSLLVSATGYASFTLDRWTPLIGPARTTTPQTNSTTQIGVAIFRTTSALAWNTIGTITMTVAPINGESERLLTWTKPGLLSEVH